MSRLSFAAAASLLLLAAPSLAQQPVRGTVLTARRHEALRVPQLDSTTHPLAEPLQLACDSYVRMQRDIRDYTCVFMKRERINGRLGDYEWGQAKFLMPQYRGDRVVVPYSVYLKFQGPAKIRGREVVYVEGKNNGRMMATKGGSGNLAHVTVELSPTGRQAMAESRYPITEMGIFNLTRRMIEIGVEDMQHGDCQVQLLKGAKINDRSCTFVQITHPDRRDVYRFHVARIFLDEEHLVPVRYEAYDWPKEAGGEPRLMEEYTFVKFAPNVGLDEWDFDHRNPAYAFRDK